MKSSKSIYQYIPKIACILFSILFIYAGTSKLLDFQNFKTQLGQSPILTAYAEYVSWGIPSIEFILAGLLLFTKQILLGLYASYALMVMFTAYIIIILNFSDYIPCSCGGVLESLGWTEHLIFNSGFVVLAILSILILKRDSLKPNTISNV
ncbi:hypothetical protein ESY86_18615 [Subsaximicrobium wynnwilliamsii]|uniref:Methylamine utilisation protein MauE domain-containing protein n=1 Tax=Subsaximicrobium wynnwilliamsii TaxID=291179 RepID=A0A5C6ZCY9_9FLAO|nr:MauE/DoxX family redox-associated membrane protein [Subsaximicrobium wynnwilliamsii]TXD81187.1 hypothetical protein ESY87_19115 [Subsaximicrobium wynnwilliamsii]TXD87004.1 hypothetical protein ESY86_18615 [Subsaximicrobium wynnwilliamsii]TXE00657.1 hypothetical protein ESY88_18915 [Subsaximicrobium wynnwilliamsii]